jgi:hypothetical protein
MLSLSHIAMNAQTTGSLSGAVTDPQGAVIAGAAVTLKNTQTGVERTAATNDRGVVTFTQLQPGSYSLAVESSGFKKTVVPNVAVAVSIESQVSIMLEVGLASETVTVTSGQEVINSSSPSLTNVINTRQVVDLPLPTRNPLDLAALQAGIAVQGTNTRGASVGGLRGTATNVTQDGINAMDNFVKTSSFFAIAAPSLNSTAEFSITTNTVGSESGRGVAQVNLVTKGGANDFHGGGFYLMRNEGLNANTFFNNATNTERQLERQHFFGFDIGGRMFLPGFGEGVPALWDGRDKAFFFFSFEGFRENFSATRNRTVLTPEARAGIFRYRGTNGATQTVNLLAIGNVGVLNPITKALIDATPLPNNTLIGDQFNTAGYRYNVTGTDPNDKYVFRYDHQLVKETRLGSHKFEFVFNRAKFLLTPDTFNGLEAPFPGAVNAFQSSTRSLVTGALVSQFGDVTNVFRYGRQWAPVGFVRDANATEPYILFSGITNPQNTFQSQGRNTIVKQFSDNLAMPNGNHLFRMGTDIQRIFADTFNDAGINQTITLGTNSANPNGLLLSEFPFGVSADVTRAAAVYANIVGNLASSSATFNVRDATSGFVRGQTRSRVFQQTDIALFAQDQWRFRPNLTLNLGVRWEFEGVPTIPNGLAIQIDPKDIFGVSGSGNVFNPNAPTGPAPAVATLNFVSGNTGIGLYNNDWNNFAPFFGIAYSPDFKSGIGRMLFGDTGKSSIRLGYSISYLHDGFTVISNALGVGTTNPGLIATSSNTTPTGVLTGAGVSLATPVFQLPLTDRQIFDQNPGNGLWAIDRNLRIPYVQQWNVGFEREIFKDTAIEFRYVGNRALKVWRANNFNEVNIFENGFLQEFRNARINLAARGGTNFAPGCAGCVPLPILSTLFTGLSAGSGFGSSGFISNLNAGNVATFASTLATSNTYKTNRQALPSNFFLANPNASTATLLSNDSMSNYNAFEVEFRRRFSGGLQFQADYTFSKALNNAIGAQGSQSDLSSWRTLRDKRLDYLRSTQDQTHRFIANAIYELPFGRGKRFGSGANGVINRLIGGWTIGSIIVWSTNPPWFVSSGRSTFNNFNAGNNPVVLTGITFEEFKKNLGIFNTDQGMFFINPNLLNISVNPTTGAVTSTLKPGLMAHPEPGSFGNFPLNSLPSTRFFNIDASLVKRVPITETVRFEIKATFINVLNHPNFAFGTQSLDSTSFGRITGTTGSQRIVHFTSSLRF